MSPGKIPGQRNTLLLALRGSQVSHKGSMSLPPPTQYQGSHGFYTQGMSQEVQTRQAEWSHTGHQWDYQSTLRAPPSSPLGRAPPSSSLGRAPPSSSLGRAPPSSSLGRAPPSSSLGRAPPSSSLGRAPPSADEHIAEDVPQAPADEDVPQAPADAAEVVPQAPADAAEVVSQAPADAAEPAPQAPRSPAAQEPVDALYSPLGEEYIALQRRLITSCESRQRGQERFYRSQERFHRSQEKLHRSQERLHKRSIELQRDMAASLNGIVQNQSQMMRILSDMQMQMDNRWR
ncbi:putative uncharacterized protein ENSP00000383309 [Bombina bombina]|uniref:putative uncharacterized protein ENSP00000383309 n=1 Tax=Bombina bombina TaxID=8345 RepID=UPI00235A5E94|nr:putative uncharacterized protein ENSP00000383309 [Bombina bombina]XP_053564779.1 putative uncharacterized protein ENSP00000383309 [Bombina bombina]